MVEPQKTEDAGSRFDYFYGRAAENYQFFRIPKTLVTDKRYRKVSRDAKLLYGLLLDRASLSYKNNWIDEEGRVYIIYSIKEIMDDLCCSNKTAVGFLSELDTEKGIGLIEKVRKGQGEKSWIYVKDFTTDAIMPDENENDIPEVCNSDKDDPETLEVKKIEKNTPETLENTEKCKNYTSRSVEQNSEVKKLHFKKCKNYTSGNVETTLPEVKKLHRNSNTDNNNTNIVILNQSSSRDDLPEEIVETCYVIAEQTGITFNPDEVENKEENLIAEAMAQILREDISVDNKNNTELLLRADRRDIEVVNKKIARYSGSVRNPIEYTKTVLLNTLKERYLPPARHTGTASYETKRPAAKPTERQYSGRDWDEIERELLRASGYDI